MDLKKYQMYYYYGTGADEINVQREVSFYIDTYFYNDIFARNDSGDDVIYQWEDLNVTVKEAVSIPVIGNGDIVDCFSAKKMIDETGVDAIMIGRGALGNPWIFKEISEYLNDGVVIDKPSPIDRINMCLKHIEYLSEIKIEKLVCLEIRNHIAWYLKGLKKLNKLLK